MKSQTNIENNGTLTAKEQSIVNISALTAVGNIESLKKELVIALEAGLTVNEIKEELVQLYAYSGFPRSLNAITNFMKVLDERKSKGIIDPTGKEIKAPALVLDKYEKGRKVLEVLTKQPQSKPAKGFGEFSPEIDRYLKEHLFADIFESDVLSYKQRELITISALAAMTGTEGQLQAHIVMGMNTGLTESQLLQAFTLIEKQINLQQAELARKVLLKIKEAK